MLLRARDKNIQSFAYIWLHKGNENEFRKHPKIKCLDAFNFRMLTEFVLISFMKPDVRKTLNMICFIGKGNFSAKYSSVFNTLGI